MLFPVKLVMHGLFPTKTEEMSGLFPMQMEGVKVDWGGRQMKQEQLTHNNLRP